MRELAGVPRRPRVVDSRDPDENRERALALWDEAKAIKGTLAEAYLATRHLDPATISNGRAPFPCELSVPTWDAVALYGGAVPRRANK